MDLRRPSTVMLFLLLGTIFCGFVAIMPELVPAFHAKSGYVWTPFNSQNFRIGDTYYYAPWLREVLAGHWPLGQPTAVGNGITSIDALRAVPFALGAVPGLFIEDFRWVLAADYWISGALSFALVYGIAIAFGCSAQRACVAGIAGYFLNGMWAALPPSAEFLLLLGPLPSVSNWTQSVATNLVDAVARLWNPQEYDLIGDLFRFVNLSLSAPLLIAHFYVAVSVRQRPSPARIIGLLVISCAIAFSYPSHPIVAYLVLIGFAADGILRRDRRCLIAFGGVGLATIVVLLGIGYPRFLADAYAGSTMMNAIYFSGPVGLRPIGVASLFHAFVLNKYVISLPLVAWPLRRRPLAFSSALVCGGVAIALSAVVLLNPMILWPRFFGRGIDPLWWVVVTIGIVEGFGNLANRGTAGLRSDTAARLMAGAAVVCLVTVPLFGFARFGVRNAQGLAHYIPTEQWQTYRWVSQNLPKNAEIAALDWNDIDLLPVFTDANLVFGHTDLAGTTSDEQLRRYLAVWRYVGLPPEALQRIIVESISASRRRVAVDKLSDTPFLDQPDYEASQFAESLVYWPYLGEVNGVPFAGPASPSVSGAFVTAMLNRYEALSPTALPDDIRCDYLLVSDYDRPRIHIPPNAELVFENARRALYRLHRGSTANPIR
jgi:hypothetical protein